MSSGQTPSLPQTDFEKHFITISMTYVLVSATIIVRADLNHGPFVGDAELVPAHGLLMHPCG